MLGMLGALTLTMDKRDYAVGDSPTYAIQGGLPNSQIAWTSFKDGQATGEYQAFYGHYLDETGSAIIPAVQPWDASHVGLWQKQVINFDPANPGNPLTAQALFTVSPTGQAPAGSSGGTLGGSVNILGMQIPLLPLLLVGGVAAFVLFKR